jgi:hypothetical protein
MYVFPFESSNIPQFGNFLNIYFKSPPLNSEMILIVFNHHILNFRLFFNFLFIKALILIFVFCLLLVDSQQSFLFPGLIHLVKTKDRDIKHHLIMKKIIKAVGFILSNTLLS